jgi:hypothetical protein
VTPAEAATLLGVDARRVRAWLRSRYGAAPPEGWDIDASRFERLRAAFGSGRDDQASPPPPDRVRDEIYVIDLCDKLFGLRASRQHRFGWLVGDPGADGRARHLPVDAYFEELGLVVEYREHQHDRPVPFFDKTDRVTVSGVHRGEQRRIYDRRRNELIPQHGLRLWVISPDDVGADRRGRLSVRDPDRDLHRLEAAWARFSANADH